MFLLYSKSICLVISEANISFYALLLRRICCISGFQPLLGESPIRSLILFPAPSIPSSTVGLGDERRGRFVPQTIWQCFFLLSSLTTFPSAITWDGGGSLTATLGPLYFPRSGAERRGRRQCSGSPLHPPRTQLTPSASVLRIQCACVWRH